MANTLVPYPTQFTEAAQIFYDHVSGGETSRNSAIHAAYQIVGFGLGKFVPDPDSGAPVMGDSVASPEDIFGCGPEDCVVCDDETCCCDEVTEKEGLEALKKCCGPAPKKGGVKGAAVMDSALLKTILAFAMQKLMEWLVSGK